ncbi:MAG: HEAT repeat domain-containing protein [Gemmatimonadota bacterium]|nr:MAG: HEAT repeat domain-containing protein [Gemmatimonadota bacterium]
MMSRRVPTLAAVTMLTAAAATLGVEPAADAVRAQPSAADAIRAGQIIEAVSGISPIACEMIVRSLGVGWSWGRMHREPDAIREHREIARWVSGALDDLGAIAPLRAALDDSDACVPRIAARLLGRTEDRRAIDSLLDALASPNARTRQLAAVGLGYAEAPESVDPLLRALRDDAASVRAAAAWALGELEDERAVGPLARLLSDDPEADVRRAAALALGNIY